MSGYESEFQMFSAGEGELGTGIIILDDFSDRAVPCPEAAWPSLRSGNWRIKPLADDGRPTPLFLLARAFVISLHATEKRRLLLDPSDSEAQAYQELRDDSRADGWARDARLQAVTSCQLMLDESASELVGSNEQFIEWFKSFRKRLKMDGDRESTEVLDRYIHDLGKCLTRLLTRLETFERDKFGRGEYLHPVKPSPDIQPELLELCNVIGSLASRLRRPPTMAEVRNALQSGHSSRKLHDTALATNRFKELLEMVGFQWLPKGKAGRPPKDASKKIR